MAVLNKEADTLTVYNNQGDEGEKDEFTQFTTQNQEGVHFFVSFLQDLIIDRFYFVSIQTSIQTIIII